MIACPLRFTNFPSPKFLSLDNSANSSFQKMINGSKSAIGMGGEREVMLDSVPIHIPQALLLPPSFSLFYFTNIPRHVDWQKFCKDLGINLKNPLIFLNSRRA